MIIDNCKVIKVTSFLLLCEDLTTGRPISIPISYALLTKEQREAQNEYWEEIEKEFKHHECYISYKNRF